MNIVQINLTYGIGSTGKIMKDLNDVIKKNGHSSFMVAGYSIDNSIDNLYSFNKGNALNAMRKDILISRITGEMGYRNKVKTINAIQWIKSKEPDIIHLHNIHGDWINVELLFKYLKEIDIPVVWTLHDCWSFTGRCSYFDIVNCNKWQNGCKGSCKNKIYPITYFFNKSEKMWNDKKKWFTDIEKIQFITPSSWLNSFLKYSFFKDYPRLVINNGINLNVFHKIDTSSKYLTKANNKSVILGVANSWTERKGLNDFIKLNEIIDHEKFVITIVGLTKLQLKELPSNIIGIEKTNNQQELVELYSNSSVFFNPTYQDNFPTTNLESLACGTPIVTYNTGGSPESIIGSVGYIVDKGNIEESYKKIIELCNQKDVENECINTAKVFFNKDRNYLKYIKVYEKIKEVNQ